MFKNVYEVLAYLGEQTELFKPIGAEMLRLKNENEKLGNSVDQLMITVLMGGK